MTENFSHHAQSIPPYLGQMVSQKSKKENRRKRMRKKCRKGISQQRLQNAGRCRANHGLEKSEPLSGVGKIRPSKATEIDFSSSAWDVYMSVTISWISFHAVIWGQLIKLTTSSTKPTLSIWSNMESPGYPSRVVFTQKYVIVFHHLFKAIQIFAANLASSRAL